MPLKSLKKHTAEALTLEWILHVKNYKLTLDKRRCVGCQICALACPKEAIKIEKQPKIPGEKAKKAEIDIDLAKCNFCGICDVSCPYGAMKLTLNGEHVVSVIEKESFPELIREIQVDTGSCPIDCVKCEEVCPLSLIEVTRLAADGRPIEDFASLSKDKKKSVSVEIDIQREYCPCCRLCEFKCPEGAIKVRKFFQGKIAINMEKCPEGCTDCLDVCPITGALYLSDEDKKVHVNETFCVYCGACKVVCPVEEALELKRTRITHTPVRSGAWNKALEKLASPVEMVKELKIKSFLRVRDSAKKRVGLKRS